MMGKKIRIIDRQSAVSGDSWLLSLTDLICVLLAFFVLRFAMAAPQTAAWNSVLAVLGAEPAGRPEELPDRLQFLDSKSSMPAGYLVNVLKMQLALGEEPEVRVWRRDPGVILAIPLSAVSHTGADVVVGALVPVLESLGDLLRRLRNEVEIVGVLSAEVAELDDPEDGVVSALDKAEAVAALLMRRSGRQGLKVSVQLGPWAWLVEGIREPKRSIEAGGERPSVLIIIRDDEADQIPDRA